MTFKNNTFRNLTITSIIVTILITSGIGVAYATITHSDDVFIQGNNVSDDNILTIANNGVNGVALELRSDDLNPTNTNHPTARIYTEWVGGAWTDSVLELQTPDTSTTWKTALAIKDAKVGIGTTNPTSVLSIKGADADPVNGPHVRYYTDIDSYPLMEQKNWTHDNISLNFDSYYDGGWKSSDVGSNFQIYKGADELRFTYESGVAQGSPITWNYGIVLLNTGNVGIGIPSPTEPLQVNGIIHSTTGGIKFPDDTIQTTASTGGSGDITSVIAGTGLSDGGTTGDVTLNVDTTTIQNRVTAICAQDSSIRIVNVDGTVSCETDDDTQLDQSGIESFGFVTGAHTTDTTLNQTGIEALGFVTGTHTINTDTQLDQAGIETLGFVTGAHTVDTTLDQTDIQGFGFVTGPHTTDTTLDQAGIEGFGFVTGAHTIDTTLTQQDIENMGFVTGTHTDLWVPNGNDISYTTGNIGIGTASPAHTLEVAGSAAFGSSTSATELNTAAFGAFTTASGANSAAFGEFTTAQPYGSFVVGRYNEISGTPTTWIDTQPLFVIGNGDSPTNTNNALTVLKDGKVGIGIANPTQPLQVAGVIESTIKGFKFPDGTTQSTAASSLWTETGNNLSYTNGNVGIGTTSPSHELTIQDSNTPTLSITDTTNTVTLEISTGNSAGNIGTTTDNDFKIKTNDITRIMVEKNGNVGIGLSNPNSALEVVGYIELDKSNGKPPSSDCTNPNEIGRMIVDSRLGTSNLYVCTPSGWATFTP